MQWGHGEEYPGMAHLGLLQACFSKEKHFLKPFDIFSVECHSAGLAGSQQFGDPPPQMDNLRWNSITVLNIRLGSSLYFNQPLIVFSKNLFIQLSL